MIYFISGGTRSGKSTFAENLACSFSNMTKVYIATAKRVDEEMETRIKKHQIDRCNKNFKTIECEYNLPEIFNQLTSNDVVILDCLTNLLANEMFDNKQNNVVINKLNEELVKLHQCVKHLIIVSNDVYNDEMAYLPTIEAYQYALAQISIKLAKLGTAYEIINGIALRRN